MANEPQVIRQQMDETRSNLTDKLDRLEQHVVQTVEGATSAVTATVENVKGAVEETVQTVKTTVEESVASVKETFDLQHQVQRRPWTVMTGAAALGFLGGCLMRRGGKRSYRPRGAGSALAPELPPWPAAPAGRQNGTPPKGGLAASAPEAVNPAARSAGAGGTWLNEIGDTFQEELRKLKGLAIGTALGIVRDLVAESVPESIEKNVTEVIDGMTAKLGGVPIAGQVLPDAKHESSHEPFVAEKNRCEPSEGARVTSDRF